MCCIYTLVNEAYSMCREVAAVLEFVGCGVEIDWIWGNVEPTQW
jgi:hypothetical protein